MAKRNLGGMGERHLGAWCDEVGITANPVERDETGWDYMLEFPLPHPSSGSSRPLDLAPKAIRCLVQVKATDQREPAISVKLDNWVRMATETIPAFFLVLEYDQQSYPQRGYLVHVGEALIRSVLRRLRELSTRDSPAPLHRQTMALTYGAADQLRSVDGAGLEEVIRRHVGDDPHRYEEEKRQLIQTLGYEEGPGELRARMLLRADDPDGHLVDLALGRVEAIPLEGGEFRDVRFGIPAREPTLTFPRGSELRGGQYRQDTVLRFRSPQGRVARMRANVFSPKSVLNLVHRGALRMRIANPFIELVAGFSDETDCSFSMDLPDPDESLSLADLAGFADFLMLNRSIDTPGSYLDVRFMLGAREVVQRIETLPVPDTLITWAEFVQAAWSLAETFGLPLEMMVTQREILQHAEELRAASGAIRGETRWFALCTSDGVTAPTGNTQIPWVYTIAMGEQRMVLPTMYVGVLAPAGSPEPGRSCYSTTPTAVRVVNERLLLPGETFGPEDHLLVLESVASAGDGSGPVWRWWLPSTSPE